MKIKASYVFLGALLCFCTGLVFLFLTEPMKYVVLHDDLLYYQKGKAANHSVTQTFTPGHTYTIVVKAQNDRKQVTMDLNYSHSGAILHSERVYGIRARAEYWAIDRFEFSPVNVTILSLNWTFMNQKGWVITIYNNVSPAIIDFWENDQYIITVLIITFICSFGIIGIFLIYDARKPRYYPSDFE
jgi:hypothetical protein